MISTEVQRTLVKSPPELWAELSDPAALARHLGELGEIRITRVQPEDKVEWEAEGASGTITIKPSGWGTKVTLSVTYDPSAATAPGDQPGADSAGSEAVAAGEPAAAAPEVAPEPAPEPEAAGEPEHAPAAAGEPDPPAAEDEPAESEPVLHGNTEDEAAGPDHVLHEHIDDAAADPEHVLHEPVADEAAEPEHVLHEPVAGYDDNDAVAYSDEPHTEHLHAGAEYDLPVDECPLEEREAFAAEDEPFQSESRRGFFGRMLDRWRRPRPEPIEEPPAAPYEIDIERLTGGFVRAASEGATYAGREFGADPAEGAPGAAPAHFEPAQHEHEAPAEAFTPGPEPESDPVAAEPEAIAAEPEAVASEPGPAEAETLQTEPTAPDAESAELASAEPVVPTPETGAPEPVAVDAGAPEAAASHPDVPDTAEQPAEAQAAALGDELRAAEEAGGERVEALLTATLDRLGAAHHRPFSRS